MAWNRERFAKDDPWVMAKLAGVVHREEAAVESAKSRKQAELREHEALRAKGLHPDRFVALKQSIDGNYRQWGHQRGKTFEECRDQAAFPPGVHCDLNGEYIWTCVLESL